MSHVDTREDRRIGVRVAVVSPNCTSFPHIGISFICRHRPLLKVSRRHSGQPPDRCEDLRRIPICTSFTFVPLPPPFVTLGLTPALGPTTGVYRTGVKDPTLSRVFFLFKSRRWLARHPLPWYQCTDFRPPRRPVSSESLTDWLSGSPLCPVLIRVHLNCRVLFSCRHRQYLGLTSDPMPTAKVSSPV